MLMIYYYYGENCLNISDHRELVLMVDNFVYQTALCKVEGVDAYQFSGWRGGGVGRYYLTDHHQLGRFHTV